jgi:hypothetical protein
MASDKEKEKLIGAVRVTGDLIRRIYDAAAKEAGGTDPHPFAVGVLLAMTLAFSVKEFIEGHPEQAKMLEDMVRNAQETANGVEKHCRTTHGAAPEHIPCFTLTSRTGRRMQDDAGAPRQRRQTKKPTLFEC